MATRARSAATLALTTVLLAAGAAPAWADDAPMPGSANDTVMSTGQAILVFVGIPAVVIAVIYLLVSAPGWTRGGRASSADAWTSDPMVVESRASDAQAKAQIDAPPASPDDQSGGTSATW